MLFFGYLRKRIDLESKTMRLGACIVALICMIFVGKGVYAIAAAAPVGQEAAAEASGDKGKIAELTDGQPTLSLGKDGSDGESHRYRVSPDVAIDLNGSAAILSDLQPGDDCTIGKDSKGDINKISANRATTGIVTDLSPTAILLSEDFVKTETY